MNDLEGFRGKQIRSILAIIKLVSLYFCALVAYNQVVVLSEITIQATNEKALLVSASVIVILTFVIIYAIWSFFANKVQSFKYVKTIQVIESFVFVILFSIIIGLSNNYKSQHKFLFLLVIITTTIQMGKKYGILISIISSIVVLSIDLVYGPNVEGINAYFQNDLVLIGVFIVTAWSLGHYVEVEGESLSRKNTELKELNDELAKQDKQRRYFEEVILKNKSCYDLLIEKSNNAIIIHQNGNLVFANESAFNLLGIERKKDLNEISLLQFTPRGERDYIKERFQRIYSENISKTVFEEKVIKSTNDVIIVENTSTHFIYEGQATILSILRDITSEKQVEILEKDVEKNIELLNESREFNKLITEFFANVSHELKTPLNVIYSAVQVLNLNRNMREKNDKYLKIIIQNCHRLLRLINNLLDITKLDSGFLKIELHNYNIISVIEEITLSVVPFAKSKEIDIIFDTDIEERIIASDPDVMERIILNLLSNSIKFTNPKGKIYVNITNTNEYVIMSVKDTGVGIPEDKLKMIFERFAQVDKTFRRKCEGSGIGLSLVKSLVELHEGEIEIKSKLGKGSEFVVKIPVKIVKDDVINKYDTMEQSNIDRINIELSDIYEL